MIFGINTTCDISKLSQISLTYRLVKLRITILKYHSWYLYQISLHIMLLPILIVLLNWPPGGTTPPRISRGTRRGSTFFLSRKRGNEGALWGEEALEFTFWTSYAKNLDLPQHYHAELVQKRIKFKLRIKLNHKYSTELLTFFLSLFSCFQIMRELAKMNGAEIQNLYLFQSISPLVIRKWEKIFCETYYLIWWGTNYLKKTLAYLYSWVRKHNYVIILRVGGVGVFPIMAYTGKLHPKGVPFFGSCSSCLEEKSPMVPNPDPKQKLKQLTEWHVIVFCEQSGETWRAAPTQLPLSGFRYMKAGKDFTSWSTAWKVLN